MIKGSIVAMVTPMDNNGVVDERGLTRLVEFHVANGTDAIVAVGTTGESATLSHEEHIAVIEKVVELTAGRVPVIGGTGANSTPEALSLTQGAMEAGVDACLLVTPYYNKPTQEGLYQHFKVVAQSVAIPQILYNVPGRTACDMLPDTVNRLSQFDNIVGIKEATGDLDRIRELNRKCPQDFAIYSGEDWLGMETILAGGHGVISVTANVAPVAMHEMCRLALAGERDAAQAVDERLRGLHKALFLESNPIPAKWLLNQMGLIDTGIRLPLTRLAECYHEDVLQASKRVEQVTA